jgi:hypothetical protein
MDKLFVIASGDTVTVALPDTTEAEAMTFEGIGLEEGTGTPIVILRSGSERITYPLNELRIEQDEDDERPG